LRAHRIKKRYARHWRLMSVILATQEEEIRRIVVRRLRLKSRKGESTPTQYKVKDRASRKHTFLVR
jgi:hypothetical protein